MPEWLRHIPSSIKNINNVSDDILCILTNIHTNHYIYVYIMKNIVKKLINDQLLDL